MPSARSVHTCMKELARRIGNGACALLVAIPAWAQPLTSWKRDWRGVFAFER